MVLGHIARGAKLSIFEEKGQQRASEEYKAVFHYLENDNQFSVHCKHLWERFDSLGKDVKLNISLISGPYVHTFYGQAKEKMRGGTVLVEQLTEIQTHNRRIYDRDEIRIAIKIYNIGDNDISGSAFDIREDRQVMSDVTFDISAGGFCIVTNTVLSEESDPYYLAHFTIADKDTFLLPTEIVRRSLFQRTKIGRYDYGFMFLFDELQAEKDRLINAIVYRKLIGSRL